MLFSKYYSLPHFWHTAFLLIYFLIDSLFPHDPALQQVHMARKILAKEAENEGLSYLEYIKSKKHVNVKS